MFYDKYAQLCKQKGVSMSAAAIEAGLSKSLVTKWKTNKVAVPSPDVLRRLSVYFGVPVSELLDEDKKEQPADNGELSEDEKQFLIWYRTQATERDKAIVRAIVEGE